MSYRLYIIVDSITSTWYFVLAGGVKVVLDVGFEREELNTHIQVADFADGEQHVAVVTRTDYGRTLTIKVQSLQNHIFTFGTLLKENNRDYLTLA